jgi:hypothetical protein
LPGTVDKFWPSLFHKPDIQLVVRRIRDAWNETLQLVYTALVYNFVVSVVKLLGAGPFFTWLEPRIRAFIALFIGETALTPAAAAVDVRTWLRPPCQQTA